VTTDFRELVKAAQGELPCDLLIQNVRLVNVHTGEIQEHTNIGVYGDKIAYVGDARLEAKSVVDGKERYAIPGLIDTHLHIESSQITPPRFAEAVLPRGTTTVAIDPHEIGNVMGEDGVKLMLESSRHLPLKVFVMVPTCVPSAEGLETAGADFAAKEVDEMLGWERVIGLAEIMDYDSVVKLRERMTNIIEVGRKHNAVLDGHCMFLKGEALNAYISTGIEACHENFTPEAALTKLRAGMDYVKIRNPRLQAYLFPGPIDEYAKKFVSTLKVVPDKRSILFCTDDIMPDFLLEEGHLDTVLRTMIQYGYDPVAAVQGATISAANHLRLHESGSITPGKYADIVLLKGSLNDLTIDLVIANGDVVAEAGRLTKPIDVWRFPEESKNTVKLRTPTEDDFRIRAPIRNGKLRARIIDMASVITHFSIEEVEVRDWIVQTEGLTTLAVFERHGRSGNKCLGLAKNSLRKGAIASTISHDCHNLAVMGASVADMKLAAQTVIEMQGGVVVANDGIILAKVALPVAGLMSEEPLEAVGHQMRDVRMALRQLGKEESGFLSIWSITLAVVPSARITDKCLVDSDNQKAVPLFPS